MMRGKAKLTWWRDKHKISMLIENDYDFGLVATVSIWIKKVNELALTLSAYIWLVDPVRMSLVT